MKFYQKLNSKIPLYKNQSKKASINLCVKMCGYQNKSKMFKSLEWGKSKEKIARKRYLRIDKFSHLNFKFQKSGLFMSHAYRYLESSWNCCDEGILHVKCPWTSRENLISNT